MSKEDEVKESLLPVTQQRLEKSVSYSEFAKVRVIQKSVVYVIGLSSGLANKDILCKEEYFGQYGQIVKIVVNKNGYAQSRQSEMTYSAYVTFASPEEASLALLAIDKTEIDGHLIRSSFGTTKYCSFFLRNMDCANKDCLYLHSLADEEDTVYKEESHSNKTIFFQQQRIAMRIADVYNKDYKTKNISSFPNSGFPSVESIYHKEFMFDNGNFNNSNYHLNQGKSFRKYSNFDTSSQFSYQKTEKDAEEEVEYVLVKEPSKKNRKWKINQQSSKDDFKKRKRNYTLEDIKIPKQQDEISSPSSASTNNSIKNPIQKFSSRRKPIFNSTAISRFDFVNKVNNDNSQCPEIPEFVYDIIYKKTSSFSFFRQFDPNIVNDQEILNNEFDKINSWVN